jgi:DNA-binding CsgD family transcriptional regulator
MTTANIIRPEVTTNYTSLPNQLLGYGRYIKGLKPRDSAVLNYLLSKPPHWKIIAKEIGTALNISINTVYAALTVLQRLGIASYTRDRFGHTRWVVSIASTLYSPVIPPHTKFPHQENCDVLETNNKLVIKEKTTTRCVSEADLEDSNCINKPSITPVELVVEPEIIIEPAIIDSVTAQIETVTTPIAELEVIAEPIIDVTVATVETSEPLVQPEIELPEQLSEVEKLAAKKTITKAVVPIA